MERNTARLTPARIDSGDRAHGDTAIATIESLTHDARGVARIDGKTTFIEGALPGEQVRFRYRNKRRRYDTGALIEVLQPSTDRVAPPCPHYGVCGGCTLQHLAPPAQVQAKQRVLEEALARIGRVRPDRWLSPIKGTDDGYRRRARLAVRYVPSRGGVLVGFHEHHHSYIAPLQTCVTLDPRLARLLIPLRDTISKLSRPDRLPQVEVVAGEEACGVVFRHLEPLTSDDVGRLREFAEAFEVTVYLQPGTPDTVHVLWPMPAPPLEYSLPEFDLRLAFEPVDFVQVNAGVNRELVASAVSLLELNAADDVLDLFCGLGNFTLPAARGAARAVGYEGNPALVERARTNARRNAVDNVEFRAADLYGAGADFAALLREARYTKLLLDPPRAGAMEIVKAIPAEGPARIAYVSCNPATLARDSEYLVHVLGYRLEAAGVADMFPHTSHIESIALYTRP